MSFNQQLIKAQFKIDHASFRDRVILLCALLALIITPWFFLVYTPQTQTAAEVQAQIDEIQHSTDALRAKYTSILALAGSHDLDKLMAKYKHIKNALQVLNQEIIHYHHTYIEDKELARLLHSILNDMTNVSIDHFSTLVTTASPLVSVTSSPKTLTPAVPATPTTPAIPAVPTQPTISTAPLNTEPQPEMIRYSLSLKGDYFSILRFLKRLEALKWQLFWTTLHYHVEAYPQGLATIEFYTLKPSVVPVVSVEGAAK